MLERFLGPKHCKVHDRSLERDSVPVRYGLIKFREEYQKAAREQFPPCQKFIPGPCRVGPSRERQVMFCPDCRSAESRSHEENPDFDDPVNVHVAVQNARRDLPDFLVKRLLKQSQLKNPEHADRYLWIVYRLRLHKSVPYNAEQQTYAYPYGEEEPTTFSSIEELARVLNEAYAS